MAVPSTIRVIALLIQINVIVEGGELDLKVPQGGQDHPIFIDSVFGLLPRGFLSNFTLSSIKGSLTFSPGNCVFFLM